GGSFALDQAAFAAHLCVGLGVEEGRLAWRQAVLSRCLTGMLLEVAKLKANLSFASEEERVRPFVAAGLGCRATFFNHAKKLPPPQAPSEIKLAHSCPPEQGVPCPRADGYGCPTAGHLAHPSQP